MSQEKAHTTVQALVGGRFFKLTIHGEVYSTSVTLTSGQFRSLIEAVVAEYERHDPNAVSYSCEHSPLPPSRSKGGDHT